MSGSDRTHGNCASQPEYETNWRSLIPAMVLSVGVAAACLAIAVSSFATPDKTALSKQTVKRQSSSPAGATHASRSPVEIPRVPVSANAAEDARDVKESPRLDDARLSDSNTSSQAQWNEPKTVTAQFSAPQAAPPFDRAQNLISDSLVEIVIDSAVADHGGQQPWAASEKLNTATAEMLVEFLTSQVTELDIETVEGTRQKLISAIEQQIPIVAERERYPELNDENGPEFAPVKEMLASREDLAGLPVRGEEDCRIDAGESSAEWRFALAGIGLQ